MSAVAAASAVPSTSPQSPSDRQAAQDLLAEWTRALNTRDLGALERVYADHVRFYGRSLTRAQVLESKRKALAATPNFRQLVLGAPSLEQDGDVTRVMFHKRSGPEDALRDVFATLVLRAGPRLLIAEETDATTEKRFAPVAATADEPTDCGSAVWALVDSTREAAKLSAQIEHNLKSFPEAADLHPGGMGPMTPAETGDGTYQIAMGVHHPERFEAYAWFTVMVDGRVRLTAYTLELDDAAVFPAPKALSAFQRLCAGK